MIKTYENWNCSLSEYLQIGDLVDEEMKNYFRDVLPPATCNYNCIQIGEPYSHVDGRATYATLKRTSEGWAYAGHCWRGQTEEPHRMII
jgi:hypothetical protein